MQGGVTRTRGQPLTSRHLPCSPRLVKLDNTMRRGRCFASSRREDGRQLDRSPCGRRFRHQTMVTEKRPL